MPLLLNSAEGGTNGTTVTTGNSGGNSGTAFDAVSIGSGAALTYDSTRSAHGNLSYNFSTGVTAVLSNVQWTTIIGGFQPQIWFRAYSLFTSVPAATQRIFTSTNGSTGAAIFVVLTTGHIQCRTGAAGTQTLNSTNAITAGQWFRLEGFVIGDPSVGQVEFKLFLGGSVDSITPTETQTSAATVNTTGQVNACSFGISTNTANAGPYWEDDIGLSTTGYIGPVISPPVLSNFRLT
jgi:hypothetical protein